MIMTNNLRSALLSGSKSTIRNPQYLSFLGVCVLLGPLLLGQGGTAPYVIYGRVSLPDGAPAPRATVKAERQGGTARQAIADDSGRFEISDISRGRYYVSAENPADPDQYSDPVEVETGRMPGLRLLANIYLKYRTKVVESKPKSGGSVTLIEEAQNVPKAAQKAFNQAVKQRSENQYQNALKSFDKAIEVFPEFFQAYSERGHTHLAMADPDGAAKDFAQALRLNAGYAPALRGAGLCEFLRGQYLEAVRDLEKAASAETGNATTHLFLGAANLALDRRDQARANLEKALAIDPIAAARAHVHLANLYIKENQPDRAAKEIQSYLEIVPNSPDANKLRALLAQLQSRP